jgi:hypothetical protein
MHRDGNASLAVLEFNFKTAREPLLGVAFGKKRKVAIRLGVKLVKQHVEPIKTPGMSSGFMDGKTLPRDIILFVSCNIIVHAKRCSGFFGDCVMGGRERNVAPLRLVIRF